MATKAEALHTMWCPDHGIEAPVYRGWPVCCYHAALVEARGVINRLHLVLGRPGSDDELQHIRRLAEQFFVRTKALAR